MHMAYTLRRTRRCLAIVSARPCALLMLAVTLAGLPVIAPAVHAVVQAVPGDAEHRP